MTRPRSCSRATCLTPRRCLGLAVPVLALVLSLLPGLSPVVRAQGNEYAEQCVTGNEPICADPDPPTFHCLSPGATDPICEGIDPIYPPGVRQDLDGDGLYDDDEWNIYGTDPYRWDTDGDGSSDGAEVYYGTDPLWG